MKTVILTVNVREAYGDKPVTAIVGVYQFRVLKLFNEEVAKAAELMQKRGHIAASDRPRVMRELLAERGYQPLKAEEVFASTH